MFQHSTLRSSVYVFVCRQYCILFSQGSLIWVKQNCTFHIYLVINGQLDTVRPVMENSV